MREIKVHFVRRARITAFGSWKIPLCGLGWTEKKRMRVSSARQITCLTCKKIYKKMKRKGEL